MPNPRLYLTPVELAAFRAGRKTEHRVPVRAGNSTVNGHGVNSRSVEWLALDWPSAHSLREPNADYPWTQFAVLAANHHGAIYRVRSRIEPGMVVDLPEAWRWTDFNVIDGVHVCGLEYHSDGDLAWEHRAGSADTMAKLPRGWQSPVTMPAWAVRTRARILEVRAEWGDDGKPAWRYLMEVVK
jgi:hypothetical protein